MNKRALTEADIRSKLITPAIVGEGGAGWNLMTQVLEEHYFTKGRVIVRGQSTTRGEAKKADYILFYKPNLPLAVVEAKDNNHSVGSGMQQALEYAEILDVPFAYSSNGDAFLEHDRTATSGTVTREIPLDQFPAPEELWARYRAAKGYTPEQEAVVTQEYYEGDSQKTAHIMVARAVMWMSRRYSGRSLGVPVSTKISPRANHMVLVKLASARFFITCLLQTAPAGTSALRTVIVPHAPHQPWH
jgi:type I site-specific restriction endonuclease